MSIFFKNDIFSALKFFYFIWIWWKPQNWSHGHCCCCLGGSLDPQSTSHHSPHPFSAHLHLCSDQPTANFFSIWANLFVRFSGWRSDSALSGLHLLCFGPPQQYTQGPEPHRQPPITPTPTDPHLFSSPCYPSLPLCLFFATTFPVQCGGCSARSSIRDIHLRSHHLYFISSHQFHSSHADSRPFPGLQECKWSLWHCQILWSCGPKPDSETCYHGISQSEGKFCDKWYNTPSSLPITTEAATSTNYIPTATPSSERVW